MMPSIAGRDMRAEFRSVGYSVRRAQSETQNYADSSFFEIKGLISCLKFSHRIDTNCGNLNLSISFEQWPEPVTAILLAAIDLTERTANAPNEKGHAIYTIVHCKQRRVQRREVICIAWIRIGQRATVVFPYAKERYFRGAKGNHRECNF